MPFLFCKKSCTRSLQDPSLSAGPGGATLGCCRESSTQSCCLWIACPAASSGVKARGRARAEKGLKRPGGVFSFLLLLPGCRAVIRRVLPLHGFTLLFALHHVEVIIILFFTVKSLTFRLDLGSVTASRLGNHLGADLVND